MMHEASVMQPRHDDDALRDGIAYARFAVIISRNTLYQLRKNIALMSAAYARCTGQHAHVHRRIILCGRGR